MTPPLQELHVVNVYLLGFVFIKNEWSRSWMQYWTPQFHLLGFRALHIHIIRLFTSVSSYNNSAKKKKLVANNKTKHFLTQRFVRPIQMTWLDTGIFSWHLLHRSYIFARTEFQKFNFSGNLWTFFSLMTA